MSDTKKVRPTDGDELSDADMEAVIGGLDGTATDSAARASGAASFAASASSSESGKVTFGAGIKK